jgi:RHS repeat-associated protein
MSRPQIHRSWFLRTRAIFESMCDLPRSHRSSPSRRSARRAVLSLVELERRENPAVTMTVIPSSQTIEPNGTAQFTLVWAGAPDPYGPWSLPAVGWTVQFNFGDGISAPWFEHRGASGSVSLTHQYSYIPGTVYHTTASLSYEDESGFGRVAEGYSDVVVVPPPPPVPIPPPDADDSAPPGDPGPPTPGAFAAPAPVCSASCAADSLQDNTGNVPCGVSSGPVRYFDGVISYSAADLASDGFGTSWSQTLSWTNAPAYAGDSVNGNGVVNDQMPHLVDVGGGTVAAVTSGTTARYFDLVSGTYYERFFGQATFTYDSTPGEFVLTDLGGSQYRFDDFDTSLPAGERGQLLSVTDANGDVTTVTRNTDGTAGEVQRTTGTGGSAVTESYLYDYLPTGNANAGRVASVILRRNVGGGSWSTVREVDYAYYDGTDSNGNLGDLKTETIKDADGNPLGTDYYRYYISNTSIGYTGGLKYHLSAASFDRMTGLVGPGYTPLTATDTQLAPYADNYFEYDSSHRVTLEEVQGQGCSACSGGLGEYTFSYTASSNTAAYNSWAMKTVETLPDGNQNIVYTNAYGEIMLKAFKDTTSNLQEVTFYEYDYKGRVVLMADPSAVSGYDDTYADLLHSTGTSYAYLRDTAGMITLYGYATTTTATETDPGDVDGFLQYTAIVRGQTGTPALQELDRYYQHTDGGVTVTPLAMSTVFRVESDTVASGQPITTHYSYTWYAGTAQMESQTVEAPAVTAGQNGADQSATSTTVFDPFGRPVWTMDSGGFLSYTAYDPATGAVTETITDVDTTQTSYFANLPTGWSTPTGGGLNLVTTYEVDALGRVTKETSPAGNVTYTVYDDANHEQRVYAGWDTSTDAPTGPTFVSRDDRVHGYSETLTMSAAPHLTSGLPDGTEAIGSLQTLSRTYYNAAGQAVTSDAYFNLSGLTYSTSTTLGTAGTNFYRTEQGYDHRGRPNRTVSPTGTITRTVYNGQGWVLSTWVGTDDTPTSGYWAPDNLTGTNLVKVQENEYDNGGAGDGNLTQTTAYPGGGADPRVTENYFDWRDRLVATKQGVEGTESTTTNRPIGYSEYDNLGEIVSQEMYDGDGVSITSTDGVPDRPSSSLLRAKSTASYDDQEQVYQSNVWSVDPSSGAVSTNALHTDTWYDSRGDVIKTVAPGGLVTKGQYDGAGRVVTSFVTDGGGGGGGSYADALTVAGDTVLEQTESKYDADGNAIQETTRQRDHDAIGLGDLRDALSFTSAPDGGFETPSLGLYAYQYNPSGSAWTFSGGSGVTSNYSAFTSGNPTAPEGTQVAFLQNTGSFSQSLTLSGGTYVVAFKAAQRGNWGGAQTVQVLVDATAVGTFTPAGTSYQDFTTATFTVTAGSHTLTFQGMNGTGDNTAFVDQSQIGFAAARVSYAGSYYDAANRLTASIDVGTNGGAAWTRPSTVPSRSDTVLVSSQTYNDAGWVDSTTDPRAIETRTAYDALGRTTQTIENYVNGTPSDADDKTTEFTYDGDNHMLTYTLLLPSSGQQTTQYIYGVSTSTITSNDLLAAVYHPDTTTGAASSSEADTYTYDALGETTGFTDRNGTAHAYSFDMLGRPTADAVTLASGSSVDDAVLRLETAYDTQGNPYLFTSYDATSGGDVVNQVQRQFNGLGQLTAEYQAHDGAVDLETTPFVGYDYSEMAGGANHSRPTEMTYPDGFTVSYQYGSGLDNAISRLTRLVDADDTTLEEYAYLGLSTVVVRAHPESGVDLTYIGGGTGDAGDQYTGLDRFGRVVDQRWTDGSTDLDRYLYGYDRDSNVLFRANTVSTTQGELYAYDGLNQLTGFQVGTLNSTNTAITGTVARSQAWDTDAAGNFDSVTTDGTAVSRTTNAQNEVTAVGVAALTYDANGNTTTDDHGQTLVYDAWNRLVAVDSMAYAYDALSRRVAEVGANTRDLYMSAADQVVTEAVGGDWAVRQVWSPVYVDALVLRDRDTNSDPGDGFEERLYATQDANWNVTALVTTTGSVVTRYTYDPYGAATRSGTDYDWVYLHQGLRYDSVAELYDNRARAYSPTLMRFLQNDPIGFPAGDADLYRRVGDDPVNATDPMGLSERVLLLTVPGPAAPGEEGLSPKRRKSRVEYRQVRGSEWSIGAGVWGQPAETADGSGTRLDDGDLDMNGVAIKGATYGGARSILVITGCGGIGGHCNTPIYSQVNGESALTGELTADFKGFCPGKYQVRLRAQFKAMQSPGNVVTAITASLADGSGSLKQAESVSTGNRTASSRVAAGGGQFTIPVLVGNDGSGKVAKIAPSIAGVNGRGKAIAEIFIMDIRGPQKE